MDDHNMGDVQFITPAAILARAKASMAAVPNDVLINHLVSADQLEFSKTTDSSMTSYRRLPSRIEFRDAFELLRGERTHHVAHLPVAVIAPLTRRKSLHLA